MKKKLGAKFYHHYHHCYHQQKQQQYQKQQQEQQDVPNNDCFESAFVDWTEEAGGLVGNGGWL